jgi:hypothetical protein
MRLLAFLQIALLLTTSILPEGRILMSQAQTCDGGECGCSAESRNNGTCCCSTKAQSDRESESLCAQNTAGEVTVAGSTGHCCPQTTVASNPTEDSCPPKPKPKPIARCGQPTEPRTATVSSCLCGGELPVVWVSHMPQTLPVRVSTPAVTGTQSLKASSDEKRRPKADEPPTPPPNATVC